MTERGRCRLARALVTAAVLAWVSVTGTAQTPADPYAPCHEQFSRSPEEYDSSYCFYRVTFEQRRWEDGDRTLAELIARHPQNAWLVLTRGHIHRGRDPDKAEALYRGAAAAFAAAGHVAGEVEARANLANFLRPKGRVDQARREVDRVVTLGVATPDPLVKAQAWIVEAGHVQETGGDLGVAYRLLKQAQDILPADPPYLRERALLIALGAAAFRMGRLDEAQATYRRLESLALARGEALVLANARFNLLNTTEAMESVLPTPGARDRLAQLAERALATALAAPNLDVALRTHRLLADLLASDPSSRSRALVHARQCLVLAEQTRQPAGEAACAWVMATLHAATDARESRASARRARDATMRDRNPRTEAHSAGRQMRLAWQTRPRDEAVRASMSALGAIETLRELQDDGASSADLFSTWTLDYYWLSGHLLHEDGRDVAQAFAVTERMRARSLLDALSRARRPLDPAHPAVAAHRSSLEAIAAVQRQLMNPSLDGAERSGRLGELERLERLERDARRQVTIDVPERRMALREFASLAQVQSSLADDEALLSFQVGLWKTHTGEDGGGAWVIAVTRDRARAHRLPDRTRLAAIVPMFAGLVEGDSASEPTAAASLHAALMRDALATLPAGTRRLVIVPDGVLHYLPFEALRPAPGAPPLSDRYEVVHVPSATLWLHWRSRPAAAAGTGVLILADPAIAAPSGATSPARNAPLLRGLRLGRLPFAREEARAIVRHVGDVDALVGHRASERVLKTTALGRYAIVHLAAHAVPDQRHPERSAVLLVPGASGEDGLLQAREIAELDLTGRIVVLSACQTAAGAILSGEGVLSLARSFFEAGAHAVIGSRWPLRDADAANLFDTFYRHLAEGATLSDALGATRTTARESGRPSSAWAGLVLLGNGDVRPFPMRPRPHLPNRSTALPIVAALSILAVLGLLLARRRP